MKNPIEKIRAIMLHLQMLMIEFYINTKAKGGGGRQGATGKIGDWIGLTVSLIFGVYLLPVIVDAIGGTDFSGWNFTGASGAKVLYLMLPFIFVVGMIVYFIGRLLGKI